MRIYLAIIYIVLFFLYIVFSRQPDYFDAEFTRGTVIQNNSYQKSVEFREGKETFRFNLEGWGASQVAAGQTVKVIFNPSNPKEASLYSFFSYWLTLPELLGTAIGFVVLYLAAVSITGKEEQTDYPETEMRKKKKYDD